MSSLAWLQVDFMQKALAGSVLVSIMCGSIGLFVVLRRIIFISMSLAEVSSASVALAFMVGLDPSLTAIAITLVATFVIAYAARKTSRFPPEALIALVYMLASSGAILLIAKNPQGETDLMNVLFGNILTVNRRQLTETIVVAVPVLLCITVFFRYFMFTAFDREMASATGIRSSVWQTLFFMMLGGVIVIGIRMSGALLTFAYLVIPAYCGLRLSRSVKGVVAWALAVGPICTFLGLWLSFANDLPTGPSITIVLVVLGLISMMPVFRHR